MTATYVYTLNDTDGDALYVGHSANPAIRIRAHRREAWGPRIAKTHLTVHPRKAEALRVERNLIADLEPEFNVQGNPAAMTWEQFCDWSGISVVREELEVA